MVKLQTVVRVGRNIIPRGWSKILKIASRVDERLKEYSAKTKDGRKIYLDLSETMCHGIMFDGCISHEIFTEKLIENTLGKGDVFVDVGANIGYFSQIAADVVGEDGEVYAIEPHPRAFKLLKRNTEKLENVSILDVAISSAKGKMAFSIEEEGDTSHIGDSRDAREVIEKKVSTLEIVLEGRRVDFIKIDVEGHEFEVIRGGEEVIKSERPLLYFEILNRYKKRYGNIVEKLEYVKEDLRYNLFWINEDCKGEMIISRGRSRYVIAIPEERSVMNTLYGVNSL